MITRATPDDIPHMVRLGALNYAAVNPDADYDPEAAAHFLREMVFKRGAAFISHGGMIGGVLCPRWCAPRQVEAVEMLWYAGDGTGARLLAAFIGWARRCKAVPVVTSRKIPPRLAARMGLAASETIWRGADVH